MRKSLDQNEIDALFSAAQSSSKPAGRASSRNVVPFDLRRANQLSADQVVAVRTLHESLAHRLGGSLGAYLRVGFDMNLVSVEQLTYGEFVGRLPELTYFASLHLMPIDARAAIQADLAFAYPIVDVLLGGSGADPIDPRDLTEIEEQIFESVIRLIAQDLGSTWAPVLELDFQFEQRQRNVQVQSIMLPQEKILCLSFETRLLETRGSLSMVFPAVVANALLRRLSVQWSFSERLPSRESRRRVRQRLIESRFMADLSLPISPLTIRQLVNLVPGQILMLPKRVQDPIHLNIAGKPMLSAYPVRQGARRGARIEQRLSILPPSTKEQ
jgi:flagellar motor switch protein FliM